MSPHTQELLIYIETQLVHHWGKINAHQLEAQDMLQLREWARAGHCTIEPLPEPCPPPRGGGAQSATEEATPPAGGSRSATEETPPRHTHQIKITPHLWEQAHLARKTWANRADITLPPGNGHGETKKARREAAKLLDYEDFFLFCADHGKPLTQQQALAARLLLEAWNTPKLTWWLAGNEGITALLQYFTKYWAFVTEKPGTH